jgi:hypothetical protein
VDGFDRGGNAADLQIALNLEGHDLQAGANARDPNRIVLDCGDDARNVGSMAAAVVKGIVVAVEEVPSAVVVDVAVAIVVDVVAGDLASVAPDVRREIGVVVVDATIEHCDDDAAAGRQLPRLRRVDVRIRNAARLAGIVQ